MTDLKLTVLCGTNRPGARSRLVSKRLMERYEAFEGVQVRLMDLADLPVELAAPESFANKPPGFAPFVEQIQESDAVHVVSPEYNGGYPGILKLFIDPRPFPESLEKRPVAFTGVAAGRFGALRPIEQLQAIFGYRNAHIYPERIFIAGAADALDERGEVIDDFVRGLVDQQVSGFVEFARKLKG
ncbi:MAG: NAD(P)H-dependent oxidoreductase [Myxococcota bacterium]|nr:NAD(P)H-dependent oxidoreductase [Myxococcota bacterium]